MRGVAMLGGKQLKEPELRIWLGYWYLKPQRAQSFRGHGDEQRLYRGLPARQRGQPHFDQVRSR
jgi:hypothetical protein